MNTIQERWINYSQDVIPKGAGTEQRKSMKHSFYTGCSNILQLMWMLGDKLTDEDKATEILTDFNGEIESFFTTINPDNLDVSMSPKANTVHAVWCEYVIKQGWAIMEPEVHHDLKGAFYAGMYSVLNLSINNIVEMTLDAGAAVIQGLSYEVNVYFKEYQERSKVKSASVKCKKRPKRH